MDCWKCGTESKTNVELLVILCSMHIILFLSWAHDTACIHPQDVLDFSLSTVHRLKTHSHSLIHKCQRSFFCTPLCCLTEWWKCGDEELRMAFMCITHGTRVTVSLTDKKNVCGTFTSSLFRKGEEYGAVLFYWKWWSSFAHGDIDLRGCCFLLIPCVLS